MAALVIHYLRDSHNSGPTELFYRVEGVDPDISNADATDVAEGIVGTDYFTIRNGGQSTPVGGWNGGWQVYSVYVDGLTRSVITPS